MAEVKMKISDVSAFSCVADVHKVIGEAIDKSDRFKKKKSKPSIYIAGGCFSSLLAGRKVKDIDVFTNKQDAVIEALKDAGIEPTFKNDWVFNFKIGKFTVQVIRAYEYNDPVKLIESFDFTIVCAAYDGESLYVDERFFIDNAQRRLVIKALPKPLSTMQRMMKYASRGYRVCPRGLAELAKAVNKMEIDWDNPDDNKIEFYPDGTPKFLGLD